MAKNRFKIIRVYATGKRFQPVQGQSLLEYSLLLVLLSIAVIVVVSATGPAVNDVFQTIIKQQDGSYNILPPISYGSAATTGGSSYPY